MNPPCLAVLTRLYAESTNIYRWTVKVKRCFRKAGNAHQPENKMKFILKNIQQANGIKSKPL
jgi:hypothetical protein